MKKASFVLFALSLTITLSCKNNRYSEIKKIEVATGGCFGPCQYTAVSIDQNLDYHYYGGEILFPMPEQPKDKLSGYFFAKITQAYWDSLNTQLEQIHYKNLDTSYEHSVDDQSLEIYISYNDRKVKHIRAQSASLPENVAKTFYNIIKTYKVIKLASTKDTFKFETTLQNQGDMPKVNQVKFPPPAPKK